MRRKLLLAFRLGHHRWQYDLSGAYCQPYVLSVDGTQTNKKLVIVVD